MARNWRRGSFRLWVVFSSIWLLSGLLAGIDTYNSEPYIYGEYLYNGPDKGFDKAPIDLPKFKADVAKGLFHKVKPDEASGITLYYKISSSFERKVIGIDKLTLTQRQNRALRVAKERLKAASNFIHAERRRRIWEKLREGTLIFLAVPTVIFLFGAALSWAFSGFSKSREDEP